MNPDELAAILAVLEQHPRVADISIGDLRVRFAAPGAPEPTEPQAEESEPESLELPEGVYDPRKAIDRVYSKARELKAAD